MAEAYEGTHYVRLAHGADIHQPIPASDGDVVDLTVLARGLVDGATLQATIDFRNQEMYTAPLQSTSETFVLSTDWQSFAMQATAPSGLDPVFHTRVTLEGGTGGAEVDAVSTSVQ